MSLGGPDLPEPPPVIRDRRRVDPATGAVRPSTAADTTLASVPGSAGADDISVLPEVLAHLDADQVRSHIAEAAQAAATAGGRTEHHLAAKVTELAALAAGAAANAALAAERTADLQRLQAEYVNYRRRVDRDREAAQVLGLASALTAMLPVLDDIGRAREHGTIPDGVRPVLDSGEQALTGLGLERLGQPGDPFDPTIHEALTSVDSPDVTEPTCAAVLRPGYRVKGRLLRAAWVAVQMPADPPVDVPTEPDVTL
jgi:molecular chaperone GrpE